MSRVTVKVEGLRELGQAMKQLGDVTAKKIANSMSVAAAGVVRKEAILRAPVSDQQHKFRDVVIQPGNLKRNIIRKKIPKSQTDLTSEHIVTVRADKNKAKYAGIYARWQEFGTVNQPARPFLRPAFDSKRGEAVTAMKKAGERRIIAEARKAARKVK